MNWPLTITSIVFYFETSAGKCYQIWLNLFKIKVDLIKHRLN